MKDYKDMLTEESKVFTEEYQQKAAQIMKGEKDAELHGQLNKFRRKAEKTLKDENKSKELLRNIRKWLQKAQKAPVIGSLVLDIMTMIDMTTDYVKGNYKDIPATSMISIVAAMLYALSPIDLIPDFIPIAGFVDDAAVISMILHFGVGNDLKRYRSWKEQFLKAPINEYAELFVDQIVEILDSNVLICAFEIENRCFKLAIGQPGDEETPLNGIVKTVEFLECGKFDDLHIFSQEEEFAFFAKVFNNRRIKWSIYGPQALLHRYEESQYDELYTVVEEL